LIEDQKWELSILANVSGFYQKLLRDHLQGDLPVHPGLEDEAIYNASTNLRDILGKMHRWLQLLDMAITPAMVRQALTVDTDPEIAEALLRYYTRKHDFTDSDRDKTDLAATFLYRHPRVPGQWERRGYGLDGTLPLSPFEIALIEILADADAPLLPEEHVQLLREFEPLREQAQGFINFNALIDSAIVSRVRELKQSFGRSFYHPGVLATIAPYNVVFGVRFDELFSVAVGEIKTFAKAVEELGGSILSNVDGVDVTVEHVQALEGSALLKIDYVTVYIIMMIALTCGAPFFVAFGALSDKIGRRNIMTLGFALALITFWPIFTLLGTFKNDPLVLTILVFYLVILVTMVYGPIAAFLVELFPARIRYTSMSLPYHVGNGVFGGLVPAAGASIAAITGVALSGLLYPMAIAAIGIVVSLVFIREPTHRIRIWDEVGGGAPPLVPDQP